MGPLGMLLYLGGASCLFMGLIGVGANLVTGDYHAALYSVALAACGIVAGTIGIAILE